MNKNKKINILKLFKNEEDNDIILSRLHSLNDILRDCEDDEVLNIVQQKILEAIDWYNRYVDESGFMLQSQDLD